MFRPLKIDQKQFGAKVGRHMTDFGLSPGKKPDRDQFEEYIRDIYANATEFREGTFSGQGEVTESGANARGSVWFYAKRMDVVLTDKSDNFVTILQNGVTNTSFRRAKVLPGRP
jgi:hypothetical protein